MNEEEKAKYFDEILAILKGNNYRSNTQTLSKELKIEVHECNSLCKILSEEHNILKLTLIGRSPIRYYVYLKEQFQIIEDNHFTKLYNKGEAKEEKQSIKKQKMKNPIVFISYSWDNEENKEWVLSLANQLRRDGVDVILDRYYLRPGQNVPFFVENSIRRSNRIITVLTPNYKEKAENRLGGVGQEFSMINNELTKNISDNERIIPLLKSGTVDESIPGFLQQYLYVSFIDENNYENNYEELLREIYKEPKIKIPELGSKPNFENTSISNNVEEVLKEKLPEISVVTVAPKRNQEIEILANSISNKSYIEMKKMTSEIYEIAPNLPLRDIINLSKSKDLDLNIASSICLKSYIENLSIDLGANPDVRGFVFYGLSHENFLLRYRILDLISVSETLKEDFNKEIIERRKIENNKQAKDKIDSILNIEIEDSNYEKEKIKSGARNKIVHGDLNGALKLVSEYANENDNNIRNTIILLTGQYSQLNKNKMMNIMSLDETNLQYNKIAYNLLSILDEI